MKAILPIFACGAWAILSHLTQAQVPQAVGAPPPAAARAPAPAPQRPKAAGADSISGDALLRRTIAAVDTPNSIAAKVQHKVNLLGRGILGTGSYLQQGRGAERKLRLELNLQTGGAPCSVLQVCDGSQLWILEEIADRKALGHVDIGRLRNARPKSPHTTVPDGWLGLGGLSKLLTGLEGSFRFATVTESRLEELRVWTVEGRWRPEKLAELLPDQKDACLADGPVDLTKLAPNLPDRVVLHVGCDDFFPYRIEYWRTSPAGKDAKANDQPLVLMELYEVRLDSPIDPQYFKLPPTDLKPLDRTQAYLDKLGLEDSTPADAKQKSPARR